MSLFTLCFLAVVVGQTTEMDRESPSSQLQLGPLQAPATLEGQPPRSAPDASAEPSPAMLQAPASAPYRSIYGGPTEAAADAAPRLSPDDAVSGVSEPTLASLPSAASAKPAGLLLQEALSAPDRDGLAGRPVALQSLLGQATVGTRRLDAVAAYWRLAHAVAGHHYALDEQRFLASLTASDSRDEQALLAAAQATAKAERAESRLAAIHAQKTLAEFALPGPDAAWLLPADPPFVGAYRTYFQELNERGAAADDLRQVDETLPVIHELIDAQAEAVFAAGTAMNQVRQAFEQRQASLVQVLDAVQRLTRHRRAFLAAVEEYNKQIARYALSVTLPAATGERVVGMLIDTGKGRRSVLASKKDSGQIQRVSGEEAVRDDEQAGPQFRPPRLDSP